MGIIRFVILSIMLYEILKVTYEIIAKTVKRLENIGEIQFKESIKYPTKLIHLVGVSSFFVLSSFSSEFIYNNFMTSFMVIMVIAITWFYIYLSKRLIITERGIGYLGIFNLVFSFVRWDSIEFVYMEKTKVALYLKSKEKRKYFISLTKDEVNEVQIYLPSDMNKYIYSISK